MSRKKLNYYEFLFATSQAAEFFADKDYESCVLMYRAIMNVRNAARSGASDWKERVAGWLEAWPEDADVVEAHE